MTTSANKSIKSTSTSTTATNNTGVEKISIEAAAQLKGLWDMPFDHIEGLTFNKKASFAIGFQAVPNHRTKKSVFHKLLGIDNVEIKSIDDINDIIGVMRTLCYSSPSSQESFKTTLLQYLEELHPLNLNNMHYLDLYETFEKDDLLTSHLLKNHLPNLIDESSPATEETISDLQLLVANLQIFNTAIMSFNETINSCSEYSALINSIEFDKDENEETERLYIMADLFKLAALNYITLELLLILKNSILLIEELIESFTKANAKKDKIMVKVQEAAKSTPTKANVKTNAKKDTMMTKSKVETVEEVVVAEQPTTEVVVEKTVAEVATDIENTAAKAFEEVNASKAAEEVIDRLIDDAETAKAQLKANTRQAEIKTKEILKQSIAEKMEAEFELMSKPALDVIKASIDSQKLIFENKDIVLTQAMFDTALISLLSNLKNMVKTIQENSNELDLATKSIIDIKITACHAYILTAESSAVDFKMRVNSTSEANSCLKAILKDLSVYKNINTVNFSLALLEIDKQLVLLLDKQKTGFESKDEEKGFFAALKRVLHFIFIDCIWTFLKTIFNKIWHFLFVWDNETLEYRAP